MKLEHNETITLHINSEESINLTRAQAEELYNILETFLEKKMDKKEDAISRQDLLDKYKKATENIKPYSPYRPIPPYISPWSEPLKYPYPRDVWCR